MDMKAIVMRQNRATKKRNPVAKDLSDGRYHQRVVKDKTKYNRGEDEQEWKRHVREGL